MTVGTTIVSNGVISKYGLKLTFKDKEDKLFFYEIPPTYVGIIYPFKEEKSWKNIYLYNSEELGLKFYRYGGLNDARVYVHHPKEVEIIQRIDELTSGFKEIRLPMKIVNQLKAGKIFDTYEPLENWAKRFVEEFSPLLLHLQAEPEP